MPTTDTEIKSPIVNVLTKAQYNSISSPSSEEFYLITDDTNIVAGNGIEVTTSSNGETLVSLKESTLWTGTLTGGNSVNIDMSGCTRIRVYAQTWGVQHIFEINLRDEGQATSGLIDTSYPYQGGSVVGSYAAAGSTGTFYHYAVSCKVNTDKTTLKVFAMGYSGTNGSYQSENGNTQYYVYRVDGIVY